MKKHTLTNLNFNEICFLQQAISARINYYEIKLLKEPKDKLWLSAKKDLEALLIKINKLKKRSESKGEKLDVKIMFNQFSKLISK
tara:strand:- start:69 stop:323 length:255 start_codon:yes stop_codon:yes gene_type:complete